MRSISLLVLICSSAAIGLIGCEDCGPNDEPQLRLNIQSEKAFQLDTVYATGALTPLPGPIKASGQYGYLQIPLSLQADSTQFRLKVNGRMETLTVYYRRDFSYKSKHCGYVINLYAPSPGATVKTTIGSVVNLAYYPNSYRTSFLGAGFDTSIDLTLKL